MPERVFVVYIIRNLLSGKLYVGKTSGADASAAIKRRWRAHLTEVSKGRGYLLHKAIRKYGSKNFMIDAVGTTKTEADAFAMEKDWIARLSPEYNLTIGGEGAIGYKWTEEQRVRVKGRKLSDETKEKCRQHALSRSAEQKDRMREAIRHAHCGKIVSHETKLKISRAKKGKPHRSTPAILARKAAREAGQKHFPGNPCKQCHGIVRYVSTWQCVECHRLWQMNYMPKWRQHRTEMHHV